MMTVTKPFQWGLGLIAGLAPRPPPWKKANEAFQCPTGLGCASGCQGNGAGAAG